MWLFPLGAAVVSGAFCLAVGRQWWQRRRPNLLAWTLALLMFAIASFAAAAGMATAWTPTWFRLYYLFGAIVNVPVLALGTIYLLAPRRVADACAIVIAVAGVGAAIAALNTPLEPGASHVLIVANRANAIPSEHPVMPPSLRLIARVYSFAGFFVVVGGAVWSAWRLARRRQPDLKRLAVANGWIAAGTTVVAVASAFVVYGHGSPFAVGLLVGVSMMFWGFLKTRPPRTRST